MTLLVKQTKHGFKKSAEFKGKFILSYVGKIKMH
jgi:hypothetical protein